MLVAGSSVRRKNVWKRKKKGGREENIESGEAKQKKKKGMEIKGIGEGLLRNAARAFILKSRRNKSAMRTCLKNEGKGRRQRVMSCFISSKADLSFLLELKSPG